MRMSSANIFRISLTFFSVEIGLYVECFSVADYKTVSTGLMELLALLRICLIVILWFCLFGFDVYVAKGPNCWSDGVKYVSYEQYVIELGHISYYVRVKNSVFGEILE